MHGVLELQETECQGGKLSGDFANELGGMGQDVRGGHWPLPPGPSKGWATVASSGGCGGLEAQPESLGEEPVPAWDVLVVARRKRWPALPHGVHLQGCAGVSQRPGPAEA